MSWTVAFIGLFLSVGGGQGGECVDNHLRVGAVVVEVVAPGFEDRADRWVALLDDLVDAELDESTVAVDTLGEIEHFDLGEHFGELLGGVVAHHVGESVDDGGLVGGVRCHVSSKTHP